MVSVSARSLPALLADEARERPHAVALIHERDGVVTYGELEARVRRLTAGLSDLGVRSGDRVALLATNRVEWVETLFAAGACGATLHAFNTWTTPEELDRLLVESGSSVLVLVAGVGRRRLLEEMVDLVPEAAEAPAGSWRSARYPALRAIVVLGEVDALPAGVVAYESLLSRGDGTGMDAAHAEAVRPVEPAMVLYTSGSTARPKAVPLEHSSLVENGFHIGERMGLGPEDRVWLGSPLFWSYGCANALMATFTHGATLVLQEQFDAARAIALIERESCTAAYLLPTLARSIVGDPGFDRSRTSTLRTGLTIGTYDDVRLVAERMGVAEICNVYGATELYGNCCVTPHHWPLEERLTSQGTPLPGVELRIVDPSTGAVLPTGAVGEIQARGHVTPGYLGVDMVASGAMTPDGFYRTGDLGQVDTTGRLRYQARASDMIKTSGINVAPAEVEDFLSRVDGVAEVAVVGVPDPERDEIVVAHVVGRAGHELTEESLLAACRGRLAAYKIPARIQVVDALPRTDTGKLQRSALRDRALDRAFGSDTAATR